MESHYAKKRPREKRREKAARVGGRREGEREMLYCFPKHVPMTLSIIVGVKC